MSSYCPYVLWYVEQRYCGHLDNAGLNEIKYNRKSVLFSPSSDLKSSQQNSTPFSSQAYSGVWVEKRDSSIER